MNKTLSKNSLLVITLSVLTACSSAPVKNESAQTSPTVADALVNLDAIADALTQRVIAQNGALVTVGKAGLAKMIGNGANVELENLAKQAAREIGINYTSVSDLTEAQANQLVNKIFRQSASLRKQYANSDDSGLRTAANEAEENLKIKSDVDAGNADIKATGLNLYNGFGKGARAKKLANNYMKVKHLTNIDLMSPETCTVMKSLDEQAGANVAAYYDEYTNTVVKLAQENPSFTKAQLATCVKNVGPIVTAKFFKNQLNYALNNIPQAVETVEGVCHIPPKGTAAGVKNVLASNATPEALASLPVSCN